MARGGFLRVAKGRRKKEGHFKKQKASFLLIAEKYLAFAIFAMPSDDSNCVNYSSHSFLFAHYKQLLYEWSPTFEGASFFLRVCERKKEEGRSLSRIRDAKAQSASAIA
jgi:hypothetical protein